MKLGTPAPATLSSETERLCWTAGIVVGATLPHWAALPLWVMALLGVAIAWRLAVAWAAWPVPVRPLRLLLAFGAFCAVLLQYRTINGVEAGSALLVVMIALKFLESNGHRDRLVLIMISYFLLFASLLSERGPLTAVYLVLLVWLTTLGLLQLSRRGPLLGARATGALAGRLLLQSLPIMIALFVLFPRLPGPIWAVPGSTGSGASGLADTMSPGDITSLALSDEIAFRVQFYSAVPPPSDRYWRGPTMTNFNGRAWSMAVGERRGERVADTVEYRGAPTDYRVTLEPRGRAWAFALDMPQRWSGDRTLRMGSDYQLRMFPGGQRYARVDYRVTSYTSYNAREPLTPSELEMFRRLPPDSSPRTRELVSNWLGDDPEPERVIERAMEYLRSQPFFYTLTPPALGAQPVDEFLFETREGFCEHYASAFTAMMRAAGLPARVVTGYQGGELNGVGDYYIVRESDAHAWTEVWLSDRGWVRVDPVAAVAPERVALGSWRSALAGDRVPGSALGRIEWIRRALLVWDAATTYWNDWVIGYGPELQRALLDALGLEGGRRGERWTRLLLMSVGVTLAASLALSIFLTIRQRRRTPVDAAARAFQMFRRRLDRLTIAPLASGEGPVQYGARAQRSVPHAAAEIADIVQAYLRARYEPDAERAALAELQALVATFRPTRSAAST
jgi:transglutaminase-like putative cysteine protease